MCDEATYLRSATKWQTHQAALGWIHGMIGNHGENRLKPFGEEQSDFSLSIEKFMSWISLVLRGGPAGWVGSNRWFLMEWSGVGMVQFLAH